MLSYRVSINQQDRGTRLDVDDGRPPFYLINLFQMLRFYAEKFVRLSTALQHGIDISRLPTASDTLENIDRELLSKLFTEVRSWCQELNLKICSLHIESILRNLKISATTYNEVSEQYKQLQNMIEYELSTKFYLQIEDFKVSYYQQVSPLFGKGVIDKFQSVTYDIEEAGKCFALGRNTACVYHLMRITEAGMNAIARKIRIADTNPSWKVVIDAIDKELKNEAKFKAPEMKADFDFLSNVSANMHSIKIAWRNKVMHLERKYTEEEAESIFNATKGLMRYLATVLSETVES